MATIEPVNTQQVLQMGSHTEKLQQTMQQQPGVLAQQLEEEHIKLAELQGAEVQDPENTNPGQPSDPDGKGQKGRLRNRPKKRQTFSANGEKGDNAEPDLHLPELDGGEKVNIVA